MPPKTKDPRDRKGKNTCVFRYSDNEMEKIRLHEGVRSIADARRLLNARLRDYAKSVYRLE